MPLSSAVIAEQNRYVAPGEGIFDIIAYEQLLISEVRPGGFYGFDA